MAGKYRARLQGLAGAVSSRVRQNDARTQLYLIEISDNKHDAMPISIDAIAIQQFSSAHIGAARSFLTTLVFERANAVQDAPLPAA